MKNNMEKKLNEKEKINIKGNLSKKHHIVYSKTGFRQCLYGMGVKSKEDKKVAKLKWRQCLCGMGVKPNVKQPKIFQNSLRKAWRSIFRPTLVILTMVLMSHCLDTNSGDDSGSKPSPIPSSSSCPSSDAISDLQWISIEKQIRDVGPIRNCAFLLIVGSDYTNGNFSIIDLDTLSAAVNIAHAQPGSDAVIRKIANRLYIVNRFGRDNITGLKSSDNYKVLFEESIGRQSNPQDIARFSDSQGIVALHNEGYLALFDLNDGTTEIAQRIDISSYDSDGKPQASALHHHQGFVYVSLQVLNASFRPQGNGRLIRVDTNDSTHRELATMPKENPTSDFQYYRGRLGAESEQDWLILAASGDHRSFADFYRRSDSSYEITDDGALLAYKIQGDTYETLFNETQAGGRDITEAWIVSDTLGFVRLADASATNSLYGFDPSTNRLGTELMSANAGSMVYHNGLLFVADTTPTAPGVRIFSTSNLQEETTSPIPVGLPPRSMIFMQR